MSLSLNHNGRFLKKVQSQNNNRIKTKKILTILKEQRQKKQI